MKAIQNVKRLNLRRLARPFLLTYHPDRHVNNGGTTVVRDANMKAIQNLNEMIDAVEYLHDRAVNPSSTNIRGKVDLAPCYTIEFLVPSSERKFGEKKPKNELVSTRRSVDLSFTESERNSIQISDKANGKYSIQAAESLKLKAMKEIRKLLRVAGLTVPKDLDDELERLSADENGELTAKEILYNELDIDGNVYEKSRFGRGFNLPKGAKTPYEQSRERLIQKLQASSSKLRQMYEDAVEDMKADFVTKGLIQRNAERRQKAVSEIISRVRVYATSKDESLPRDNETIYNVAGDDSDGLDAIGQLIAIRRMSLLFNANFEDLDIEGMGRLWGKVSIVLTPRRNSEKNRKPGTPYSRKRRLRIGKESGFKFKFDADERCTVYIPVDFTDEEILGEIKRHLNDFCNVTHSGFEESLASCFKDIAR